MGDKVRVLHHGVHVDPITNVPWLVQHGEHLNSVGLDPEQSPFFILSNVPSPHNFLKIEDLPLSASILSKVRPEIIRLFSPVPDSTVPQHSYMVTNSLQDSMALVRLQRMTCPVMPVSASYYGLTNSFRRVTKVISNSNCSNYLILGIPLEGMDRVREGIRETFGSMGRVIFSGPDLPDYLKRELNIPVYQLTPQENAAILALQDKDFFELGSYLLLDYMRP